MSWYRLALILFLLLSLGLMVSSCLVLAVFLLILGLALDQFWCPLGLVLACLGIILPPCFCLGLSLSLGILVLSCLVLSLSLLVSSCLVLALFRSFWVWFLTSFGVLFVLS